MLTNDAAWLGTSSTRTDATSDVRPRIANIHQRSPGIPIPMLLTRCLPSPYGRLSRPRTFYGGSVPTRRYRSAADLSSRRSGSAAGGTTPGRFPCFVPLDERDAQLLSHRARSRYATDLPGKPPHRRTQPVSESPSAPVVDDGHCCPAHIRQIRAGSTLKEVLTLVHLLLHLLVLLAGPGPSDGADPSRRCRSCFPPKVLHPQDPDCSQLQRTAVTAHRQGSRTLTREQSASWRTRAT